METHNAYRDRRLLMPRASHHQGSLGLDEYRENGYANSFLYSNAQFCIISNYFAFLPQSSSHDGQPCSHFKAWVLSKKDKATANIDFNLEDPPEAYSDPSIHSDVTEYTTMAREVHGSQFDPSTQDLDGEIVMRVGGGKKHGRY